MQDKIVVLTLEMGVHFKDPKITYVTTKVLGCTVSLELPPGQDPVAALNRIHSHNIKELEMKLGEWERELKEAQDATPA